jgi:hypothetical protein
MKLLLNDYRWSGSPDSVPWDESGSSIGDPSGWSGAGPGLVGSAIATAGNVYDSYQAQKTAKRNTDATIAAQKQQADLAYQRSLQMWNLQNAYNSPEAQMARFKQAGLNPQLIYGQGNPGNASSTPEYHPPHLEYHYAAGNYGQAVSSAVLPTLMSVGEWMMDMKLKDAQLSKTMQGVDLGELTRERQRQLIDFLAERNPKELQSIENKNSLYPYQRTLQFENVRKAQGVTSMLEKEFEYQYGRSLFGEHGQLDDPTPGYDGAKKLEFLSKLGGLSTQRMKNELLGVQTRHSDMDITNPQHIIEMVVGGVMGLANSGMRASFNSRTRGRKVTNTSTIKRVGRTSTNKTEYYER